MGDYVTDESDSDSEFEALIQQLESNTISTSTNDETQGAIPETSPSTPNQAESEDKDDDHNDFVPRPVVRKLRGQVRDKDKTIKTLQHQVTAKDTELSSKEAELAWWRQHGNDYDIQYQPEPTEVNDALLAKVDEDDPNALKQTVKLLAKQKREQAPSSVVDEPDNDSWVHHVTDEQVLDVLAVWSEEGQEPDDKKAQLRWQYALEAEQEILSDKQLKSLSPNEIAKQVVDRTREKMRQGASQKVQQQKVAPKMPESLSSKNPQVPQQAHDVNVLMQQSGKDLWDSL